MPDPKLKDGQKRDDWFKEKMRAWGYSTNHLWRDGRTWVRGQPTDGSRGPAWPRLVEAGGAKRIQPDGLWLATEDRDKKGGLFADVMVLECCGSEQNFYDKRSRYAPRTIALTLELTEGWLATAAPHPGAPRKDGSTGKVRWKTLSIADPKTWPDREKGVGSLRLPVRHLRVLYFLPRTDFRSLANKGTISAHEFLAPFKAANGDPRIKVGKLNRFLQLLTVNGNIWPP